MKKTLLAVTLSLIGVQAQATYNGVLVDAHNQIGCDSKIPDVVNVLKKSTVDHTLLSGRKPCKDTDPIEAHNFALEVQRQVPNKVHFLISTKVGGNAGHSDRAYTVLQTATQQYLNRSVGFAEILVEHAHTDHKNSQFHGLNTDLKDPKIRRSIKHIVDTGRPLFLHLELNDHPEDKEQNLRDLKELAQEIAPHPILLMHMIQIDYDNARDLLEKHPNIHFVLSTNDPITARGKNSRIRNNIPGQNGWINMFDTDEMPRDKSTAWIYRTNWQSKWKRLVEKNPTKFVWAVESVYRDPWINTHHIKVEFWRHQLGKLDSRTANAVACGNAQRLWTLPISCTK